MNDLVKKIEKIIRKCGEKILQADEDTMEISNKDGIGNIVTKYDTEIQTILKKELLEILPNANFIGEEEDLHTEILEKGYTFIVDPIDGTTNFAVGNYLSAISVGLLKDGEPYIGVCYNPYLNEMFIAQKGKGAYLNNKRITVSDKTLSEGLVFTGNAPYYEELRKKSIEILNNFVANSADFRRLGSAVIELCDVACGRAEVYFEMRLQPWDHAAGGLIVEEAGGKVSTMDGEKMKFNGPCSIVASNDREDYLRYVKM